MAAAAPKLRNIGPKSAAWLRQVGLRTEADIVAVGPVEAYMRVRRAGFKPTVHEVEDLTPIREKHGVPFNLSSCHTGLIGGYAVEGHVPPADVLRLLKERPKAIGLAVPGMPIGSPGMESPNGATEAYATLLLLDRSGKTRVFARHG